MNGDYTWAEVEAAQLQPMPVHNDLDPVYKGVIADIYARHRKGVETYGEPLRPHNGRDALLDAYQEALDLCMYLKQAIEERG